MARKNPSVTFDLAPEATVDGRFVIRRAPKIFEAGVFVDKAFSMTADEVAAAAKASSIPIELEHKRTVLSGKLGEVFKLGSENGVMFGDAKLPKWLDDLLGPDDRKLSAHFDRTTKQLKEISLVLNPRIPDARLTAAFAADELEYQGGTAAMQGPELLQTVHDLIAAAREEADESLYSKEYIKKLDTILAASATDDSEAEGNEEEAAMSADPKPTPKPTPEPTPAPKPAEPAPAVFSAELEKMKAENAKLQKAMDDLRRDKIKTEAAAFAASVPNKIYPAEKDALAKLYERLAESDVTFSGDANESSVSLLKAAINARPAHNIIEPATGYRTLAASFSSDDEVERERKASEAYAERRKRQPVNGAV